MLTPERDPPARLRPTRRGLVAALALLAALICAAPAAAAGPEDDAVQRLADRYAPIVVVRDQSGPCDRKGEAYRPVPVETVLDTPEIVLLGDDRKTVLVRGPSAQDLAGRGPGTSLDFPGNPRRPGCGFEKDFARLGAGQPDVAYAHLSAEAGVPGRIVLQYWFFWYFDDYVNTHEGDWEFIQIVFPGDSAADALAAAPLEVGYSQHSGGERAAWTDDKLERQGDHPVVYSGAGSHANYFTSAVYLGRSANEGFGCDDTTGPSTRLTTQARVLPDAPDPSGPYAWLLYQGRWGEFQPPPYDAPPGPSTKKEWTTPMTWQGNLRDSSFDIPAGNTLGPTATGAFCSAVRVGGRVYTAVTSPLALGLIVLGLIGTGGMAARSTRWSPPTPVPLRRRRATGQIVRGATALYRRHPRPLLALGALFLPAAIVEAFVQDLVFRGSSLGSLVATAGSSSLLSATVALLLGGAGHLVATTIVLAGVASVVSAQDGGREVGVREAYRMLGERVTSVLGITALGLAAVVLLAITVVGIPIAVYLLVRWAVAQQACAIEGLPAREAMARSRDLTRGRFWRTLRPAALVNILGGISGPVVGIVLLFVTGLPLATINAISSFVFVVAMPLVGTAMALLYGDLAAGDEPGGEG